ncbi:alpha/beta fold hydrolase [Vulcanisaeta thermophila]|uniref:alpha/beta fold hydrolase n=1 Tax=Vulcanisaeta thermophila TaxID=867917 RepID=UPI000853287B|nr:alpha/beta hydrolase [Vulcanisaeta thermophila]
MSEQWLMIGGRRVRYLVKGDGKPMVMVHGLNFSADDWIRCCGDALTGFRIYAIDMPYGPKSRSDHFERSNPNDYAEHLYSVVSALGIEKPILVGASIGGETVLRYLALNHPALAGIVVGPVGVRYIDLSRIKVPLLGIWGDRDRVSGRENMEALRSAGFRVEVIRDAGHPAYLDKPSEFVRIVMDFLREYIK